MRRTITRSSFLLLLLVCGFFGGCESVDSVGTTVRDRLGGLPPTVRTVDGNSRQVYVAARRAMESLGYRFTGGGPAKGRLEGLSRISEDNDFRSSRQRSISIQLEGADSGKVDVQVRITEIVEDNSNRAAMPATEAPLHDSAAYDVFFEELERCLAAAGAKY